MTQHRGSTSTGPPDEYLEAEIQRALAEDPSIVDMRSVVLVGSSRTRLVAGRMVTPRKYAWLS